MKMTIPFWKRANNPACRLGYPTLSTRFEWLLTAATLWLLIGLYLDGWAHNNIPELIEPFFTPWHAVLYSGYAFMSLVLIGAAWRNWQAGYHWQRSLPQPLLWSLLGVFVFGVAGNVDLVWHELFGFEEDVEALLSPSHLFLAVGGILMTSGVLRLHWQQAERKIYGRFRLFLPPFLSFFAILSIVTFFGQFANAFSHPYLFVELPPRGDTSFIDVALISSILLPSTIVVGFSLALLRRWTVPFGTLTLLLLGNALFMLLLNWRQAAPYSLILLAPLATGLLADLFWARGRKTVGNVRLLSFLLPFGLNLLLFAILISVWGIWWAIHLWLGVSFLAGMAGLGLGLLLLPSTATTAPWFSALTEVQNHG